MGVWQGGCSRLGVRSDVPAPVTQLLLTLIRQVGRQLRFYTFERARVALPP